MGAALLKNPEKVKAILDALVKNITTIPVTCKIRVLPEMEKTVELVKIIEATGVAAIGVHGRFQTQRSSEPAHYDRIKAVTELVKIPVIAKYEITSTHPPPLCTTTKLTYAFSFFSFFSPSQWWIIGCQELLTN